MVDLSLIKKQLQGDSLKRLLKKADLTKYKFSKETGISYQTLCYWQNGKSYPSDELAKIAGRRLGLISSKEQIRRLEKEISERKEQIENIKKEA